MNALETLPVRVARLSYLNVLPFFLDGGPDAALSASPRRLGKEAEEGRADAGPLSLLDAWRLEADFEPLGDFGIAVKGPARSVLLFSKAPVDALSGRIVGITDQTSTSVKLLEVLLTHRHGVKPVFREGFRTDDGARLLIGDDALRSAEALKADFPHVVDLGRAWYEWQRLPFIFARWMVRRTLPPYVKDEIRDRLEASLSRFERNPDAAVNIAARTAVLPPARLRDYLMGFVYRLGENEGEGERVFRTLCTGLHKGCGC